MSGAHTQPAKKSTGTETACSFGLVVFSSFCSRKGVTTGNRKSYNDAVLILRVVIVILRVSQLPRRVHLVAGREGGMC